MTVPWKLQCVFLQLAAVSFALSCNPAAAQPAPSAAPVKFPSRLIVVGPKVVPGTTTYGYTTNCPVDADWVVGVPGSPTSAKGTKLEIAWGGGPAQTTIEVICGRLREKVDVEVVEVTVDKTDATLGGGAFVRDSWPLRLAGTSRPKPAITFKVDLTVTGPTRSPHWGGKIVAGFVQRLVAADFEPVGGEVLGRFPSEDQAELATGGYNQRPAAEA